MKPIYLLVVIGLAIFTIYLLVWPVKINPAAWSPPKLPPASGVYEENNLLSNVSVLADGYMGPESVAVGKDGFLYTGLADGRILRISKDGKNIEVFAQTPEPLGMKFDAGENLIVADVELGLILVDKGGKVSVLTNEVHGSPIIFADDLVISSGGKIYFSDASTKFTNEET